jgi:hypothetical protein
MDIDTVATDATDAELKISKRKQNPKLRFPLIKDWDTISFAEFHSLYPDISHNSFEKHKMWARTPVSFTPVALVPEQQSQLCDLSEVQQKILQRISCGECESQAVENEGISIGTHLRWLDAEAANESQDPVAVAKTRLYASLVKRNLAYAAKRTKELCEQNVLKWGQRAWQASAWYLERRYPAEYAKQESSAAAGNTVVVGIKLQVRQRGGTEDAKVIPLAAEVVEGEICGSDTSCGGDELEPNSD